MVKHLKKQIRNVKENEKYIEIKNQQSFVQIKINLKMILQRIPYKCCVYTLQINIYKNTVTNVKLHVLHLLTYFHLSIMAFLHLYCKG